VIWWQSYACKTRSCELCSCKTCLHAECSRETCLCVSGALALVAGISIGGTAWYQAVWDQKEIIESERASSAPQSIVAFTCSKEEKSVLEILAALHTQFLACCAGPCVPDLIIGPESCFSCVLNREPSLYRDFDNYGACASPIVILGAQRRGIDNKLFNSAYVLHQGRIIFYYDKLFPLPFLETYPAQSSYSFLQGLFFSKQQSFVSAGDRIVPILAGNSRSADNHLAVNNVFTFPTFTAGNSANNKVGECALCLGGTLYHARLTLCSDFFCTSVLPPAGSHPLVIVMANDRWFYGSSVADRMLRYAVLWAVRHQTPVLYSAYCHACWIDRTGRVWQLAAASC
jgi:hypothetical protein